MSKSILTQYDFNGLEILNFRFQNLASAPGSPTAGRNYYDTAVGALLVYNGSGWVSADVAKVADAYIPMAKLATNPLARSNHTGSQAASSITDLATVVQAYALSAFAVPTVDVSWNNKKLTNLLDPTNAQDAATKNYVDLQVQSASAGIDSKASVRALANGNITLSAPQAIDGVSVIAGDRVLVRGQTTNTQNGVYVVAAGAWTRAADADANSELTPGAFWFVEEGTTYGKTQWRIENTGAIVIGTTAVTINQFGAAAGYTQGNGINISGSVISVVVEASKGLLLTASGLKVDNTIVTSKFAQAVGDGTATSYAITHNLATLDVQVQVYRNSTPWDTVECDVERTSTNQVTVKFAVAPTSNQYRVTVQG